MKEYKELLQKAYKKLKSSVYFDKTQLILRDKIVRFETDNNLDEFFEKTAEFMSNKKWEELFQPIYDSISYVAFPKKITDKSTNGIDTVESDSGPVLISNIASDVTTIETIQTFIDMDVLGYLMGIVWILIVGYKVDQDIYEHSYGNRLRKKLVGDNGEPTFSPYLFEPYFQQYESWRDTALNIAQSSLSQKQDVVILTLDFKRFFYSVDIDDQELKQIVNQSVGDKTHYHELVMPLTDFVYKVICQYSEKISPVLSDDVGNRRALPIGFYPSNILANYCLKKFDCEIADGWNPLYYGRYVDDILIVDKVEKNGRLYKDARNGQLTAEAIISYYLENCDLWRRNDADSKKGLLFKDTTKTHDWVLRVNRKFNQFTNSDIYVQNSKVTAFYFEADQTDALIDCFRNKITHNKSEFRFLPEDEPVFSKNDYSEIYSLDESDGPNKLRGVKDISVDKYELSKFLGKYQRITGLVQDGCEKSFESNLSKIFNNRVIIDNYTSWEKVLSILAYNERFDAVKEFINRIVLSVEKIEGSKDVNAEGITAVKASLLKTLISALNRTLSVIWGPNVQALISELKTNAPDFEWKMLIGDQLLRKEYCVTRMCDKYAMSLLIDGFIDNGQLSIDDGQSTNLTCYSSIDLHKYRTNWYGHNDYTFYPYLLTMHDLTWANALNNLINERSMSIGIDGLNESYGSINYNSKRIGDSPIDFIDQLSLTNDSSQCLMSAIKIGNQTWRNIKIGIANSILLNSDFERSIKQEPNRSYERYKNMTKVVNEAIANKVNMLVMPECYIPYEWIPILARTCAKNQIAVVTGVEHLRIPSTKGNNDLVYNLTAVILPYKQDDYKFSYIHFHTKKHLSPDEKDTIESYRCIPKEGDSLELFCWNDFWFPVYCCYELASIIDRSRFQSYADAVIAVEWNPDTKYYSNIVESLSRDIHCYCIQVNSAKYGDSRITQPKKTEEKDLLNVKGGTNTTILVDTIDIGKLRNFQIRGNRLQRQSEFAEYKPTPPDFDYDIVDKKIKGTLWDYLKIQS